MRKHLTIAGCILALEAWLGIGIFGGGGRLICAPVFAILALTDKQHRAQYLRNAVIYFMLIVGTLSVLLLSARLALRRATPVISAVNRYYSDHGQYPVRLNQLVPTYLTSIPHAGFTRFGRDFGYYDDRPQLYFAGMFYGVFAYDFQTESWTTND